MSLKRKKKEVLVQKSAAVSKDVGAPLSDNPDDASRRLTNIRPSEVSLVDSAANGRTFLLVKRKGNMSKKKDKDLFKEGEKSEEAAEQTPAAGNEGTPAAEGESKPAAEAGASESKPAEGDSSASEGSSAESEESVEKFEDHFKPQAEELLQQVPVAKALAMEQKEMFLAMSDAMMSVAMTLDFIRSDIMAFAGSDGSTGFMGQEIAKGLDSDEILKRGKKMKKTRLAKLKSAVESLNALMKELEDESENVNKEGGSTVTTKDENKKVEGETETNKEASAAAGNAPEGKAGETETNKEATSQKEEASQPLTKADLDAAVEKATAPLKAEIESLKNAPADSAAEGSDDTEDEETTKSKDKKVEKSLFSGVIY